MANDPSPSPASMFPPVPGFDFLQGLVKKNAGPGLPGLGQWVAPTLDPEEVEKRIAELKAVQFWLEQNARMLAATIQALEVQRMTLATLKTMNVRMTDLRDALTVRAPESGEAQRPPAPAAAPAAEPAKPMSLFQMPSMFPPVQREAQAPARPAEAARQAPAPAPAPAPAAATAAAGGEAAAGGAVDAMQWWSALTQQFADLAAGAMRDGAEATQKLAAMIPGGTGDPAQAEAVAAAKDAAAGAEGAAAPRRSAQVIARDAPARGRP